MRSRENHDAAPARNPWRSGQMSPRSPGLHTSAEGRHGATGRSPPSTPLVSTAARDPTAIASSGSIPLAQREVRPARCRARQTVQRTADTRDRDDPPPLRSRTTTRNSVHRLPREPAGVFLHRSHSGAAHRRAGAPHCRRVCRVCARACAGTCCTSGHLSVGCHPSPSCVPPLRRATTVTGSTRSARTRNAAPVADRLHALGDGENLDVTLGTSIPEWARSPVTARGRSGWLSSPGSCDSRTSSGCSSGTQVVTTRPGRCSPRSRMSGLSGAAELVRGGRGPVLGDSCGVKYLYS
jgi:hypothetical protein